MLRLRPCLKRCESSGEIALSEQPPQSTADALGMWRTRRKAGCRVMITTIRTARRFLTIPVPPGIATAVLMRLARWCSDRAERYRTVGRDAKPS